MRLRAFVLIAVVCVVALVPTPTSGNMYSLLDGTRLPQRLAKHAPSLRTPEPDPANIIPTLVGSLFPNSTISFSGKCYGNLTATLTVTDSGGTIMGTAADPSSDCSSDWFLFAVREGYYLWDCNAVGEHTITISKWEKNEVADIELNGLSVFYIYDGILGELIDAVWFASFFVSGKYSTLSEDDIVDYTVEFMNWTYTERAGSVPPLNESDIQDGDYIAVMEYDGGNFMIALGTGGHTCHAAVCMWEDGVLNVYESQWHGVMKTPYSEWMAGFYDKPEGYTQVALARLDPTYAARFNTTAALEWFYTVEGLPYGFQNFLFGWLDTPEDNFPPPATSQATAILFTIIDAVDPSEAIEWSEALNLRLNTSGLSTEAVIAEANARNITFGELVSMVEYDSYVYPSIPAPGRSMVCSVFAMEVYRHSGMFNVTEWQAAEFTPKDSYQIDIFDKNWDRPAVCDVDVDLPYCQLVGKYRMDLVGFSSITPYENMNNHCGAVQPGYVRTPESC